MGLLNLDFGGENKVKHRAILDEGEYVLQITDWSVDKPASSESAQKGRNLKVKFKLDDPIQDDVSENRPADEPEQADFSQATFNDLIFFMFDNPFSIVSLLSAIKGTDPGDPTQLGEIDLEDKSEWIGERVVGRLVRTENKTTGKSYLNPVSDAYVSVNSRF